MPPHHWSSPTAALTLALRPIAAAFAVLVALRKRLYDWGILKTHTLPVPVVVVGNVAYLSGHGPLKSDGTLILGRVGDDMTLEQGQAAARQTARH